MGCSASRPETLLARFLDDTSSSSSTTLSSSPARALSLSLPTPLVHHLPLRDGDSHHLVSLTSSTYGSLRLLVQDPPSGDCTSPGSGTEKAGSSLHGGPDDCGDDPSPDSVINAWELMDGLEDDDEDADDSCFEPSNLVRDCGHGGEGFGARPGSCGEDARQAFVDLKPSSDEVVVKEKELSLSKKPLWKHLSEEALLAKLGPDVAYSYRRALSSRHLVGGGNKGEKESAAEPRKIGSLVNLIRQNMSPASGGEDGVVLYFTSLRGIRKTYEDCCAARMILKGFRVHVDERDVSMHSEFKKELECALGGKVLSLPRVFIKGKYVGGTEEIKEMNEAGELSKLLEGIPAGNCGSSACKTCGDVRFLPCPNCDGSRKVFDEDEGQMRRCLDCNENGLIRCYGCCL